MTHGCCFCHYKWEDKGTGPMCEKCPRCGAIQEVMYPDPDAQATAPKRRQPRPRVTNFALAHEYYFLLLTAVGRLDEAAAQIKLAQELDPLSLLISSDVGMLYSFMRKYDQSIENYQKVIEIDPNYIHAINDLAFSYEMAGDFEKAAATWERFLILVGRTESSRAVAHAYATSGYQAVLKIMIDLQ